jgi:hypothetical protein
MQPELAAAKRTLPEEERQHQAAIERLGVAAADRAVALDEVAVLAADGVAGKLTLALNQALTIEARLISLHSALLERARDGTNSSAGRAAERIAVIIRAAKRSGRAARCGDRPAVARRAGERPGSEPDMMGRMMGSAAPSVVSDELSVLRALARLLDPKAGPEIARIAANLPREDVRRAIDGLHEAIDLIVALTPIEAAVAAAIEDLQHRESVLAEREAKLVKREERVARVDEVIKALGGSL